MLTSYIEGLVFIVGVYVVQTYQLDHNTPALPAWPTSYKTCVEMSFNTDPIRAGWYVDGINKRVRLDSYGIPENTRYELYNSLLRLMGAPRDRQPGKENNIHMMADDDAVAEEGFSGWSDYACHLHGAPLYVFIFRYDLNIQYDIFPSPNPPGIDCKLQNLSDIYPASPLLPNVYFVGTEDKHNSTVNHWRASYFLFDIDYLFNNRSGTPVRAGQLTFDPAVNKEIRHNGQLSTYPIFPALCSNRSSRYQ